MGPILANVSKHSANAHTARARYCSIYSVHFSKIHLAYGCRSARARSNSLQDISKSIVRSMGDWDKIVHKPPRVRPTCRNDEDHGD